MGPICSTCVHSQIHLHYMCKMYSQSVQPFDHISQAFELLTPQSPPKCRRGISWGQLFLAYVHFQMNPQTCTAFGANRSIRLASFPDLNLWPPKTPRNTPCGIEGRIVFSLCPFPDESTDVYQIWCQSVQPFGSFPKHLNLWPPYNPRNAPGILWANCS